MITEMEKKINDTLSSVLRNKAFNIFYKNRKLISAKNFNFCLLAQLVMIAISNKQRMAWNDAPGAPGDTKKARHFKKHMGGRAGIRERQQSRQSINYIYAYNSTRRGGRCAIVAARGSSARATSSALRSQLAGRAPASEPVRIGAASYHPGQQYNVEALFNK